MNNALTGNWRTSVAGAMVGLVYFLTQNGATLPTTKEELKNSAISIGFLLLGALSKDAAVGSKVKP